MKHPKLILLTVTLLASSCTLTKMPVISKHRGVTTVAKPALTDTSSANWFNYYADQFDAYEGQATPPTDSYPEAAKKGYYNAQKERERLMEKEIAKKTTEATLLVPVLLGGLLLLTLLIAY